MPNESYTPGHSENATSFMARRSFASHGGFFHPHLRPGLRVLDVGCGPGTITLGIATIVTPGTVTGVDFGTSQIEQAVQNAAGHGIGNVRFVTASCYELPFPDETFDGVFSHALMEHLAFPGKALAEFHRVLKPGGAIGLCSPDWDGFVVAPPSSELHTALGAYRMLQTKNGGDVLAGRKLGSHLVAARFRSVRMQARYECYSTLPLIGDYLALQLHQAGLASEAQTLRQWGQIESGLFAQAWLSATAMK